MSIMLLKEVLFHGVCYMFYTLLSTSINFMAVFIFSCSQLILNKTVGVG